MPVQLGSHMIIKQSIARVELFTDADKDPNDWTLVYHFEDRVYDANGDLITDSPRKFGSRRVDRRFGDIANDTIAAEDLSEATVAQIAAWVKAAGYLYRQADIDAEQE